jgi:hypothetical protein
VNSDRCVMSLEVTLRTVMDATTQKRRLLRNSGFFFAVPISGYPVVIRPLLGTSSPRAMQHLASVGSYSTQRAGPALRTQTAHSPVFSLEELTRLPMMDIKKIIYSQSVNLYVYNHLTNFRIRHIL